MQKDKPILFDRKEQCCGCTACFAVCPKNAITMKPDEEGFMYPNINDEMCIRCYKFITVCPIKNKL